MHEDNSSMIRWRNSTSHKKSPSAPSLLSPVKSAPSKLYRWVLIDTGENQSHFVYPHNVKHILRSIEFEKHLEIEVDNEQVVIEIDEDADKPVQDSKERYASPNIQPLMDTSFWQYGHFGVRKWL